MSKVRSHFYVIAAAWLALFGGWATPAQALVLDWDLLAGPADPKWINGSVDNSYDLNDDGINDVRVELTAQQSNVWTDDLEFGVGTQTPAVNQTLTGGLSQNSLNVSADLKTHSNVIIHLSFTGAQPGAANVSFTLFDIDVTTNSDIIDAIYGLALDGSQVAATITNIGSAVTRTGTGFDQVLEGNTGSPDIGPGSSNGNATISFGPTIITDVFFTFSNTAGSPRFQNIAIGDISFTPVPEMNPATTAAASCIAAIVLTIAMQRRARRARQKTG
jgi:hypothetical protein